MLFGETARSPGVTYGVKKSPIEGYFNVDQEEVRACGCSGNTFAYARLIAMDYLMLEKRFYTREDLKI